MEPTFYDTLYMYDDFKIYKFIKNDDETLMCGHHRGFSFTWGMERGYSLWHKIKWWCVLYIGKVCRTREEWRADIHKMPLFSAALPLSFSLFSLYISNIFWGSAEKWHWYASSKINFNNISKSRSDLIKSLVMMAKRVQRHYWLWQ